MTPQEAEKLADRICLRVAELPDRTSPDDWPEALLVTGEELHAIVTAETIEAREQRADGCHRLDTPERVLFYENDFYVLSNFSAFQVEFRGISFNTSEEAYHFQRFASDGVRDGARNTHIAALLRCRSAHDAFRYAQEHKRDQRPDWDAVKVDVMRDILRAKAEQHEYVRRKLLATGDRELIEDSWRDDFWGWGPNRDGQNILGRLWMHIRAELRVANGERP